MKIAIRTDASSEIGVGHFMRCLTLAIKFKKNGVNVAFISCDLPSFLKSMLVEEGLSYLQLDSAYSSSEFDDLAHSKWLRTDQSQDARLSIEVLGGGGWDWMVVDHYALDIRWERIIREHVKKIMVIDDLADREHDCDLLLDQNLYNNPTFRYKDKIPEYCKQLLGPDYVLLREDFLKLRKEIVCRSGVVKKILVFLGGMDSKNVTSLVLEALNSMHGKYQVDVVIGAQHPYLKNMINICSNHGYACHVQTLMMAEIMAESDLAIGAGGSVSWERCYLGLPSILIAVAKNQIEIAKALDASGAAIYIGEVEKISAHTISHALDKLIDSPSSVKSISQRALRIVDGMGVDRVYNEMTL
jgi:UDP-2,4-diacetamido-2,4,6-trideoxy-beta-L-altropyranose hydrolase